MAVRPGAEAYQHGGGSVGVLLCHGFTGSPASLRPWAEAFADAGLAVSLPRLPGHGTAWQDLAMTRADDWLFAVTRSFEELRRQCSDVFVVGLSMGGTLALRLAQLNPEAIRGVVVVNPSIHSHDRRLMALPVLRFVARSVPGVINDVKLSGQDEVGDDRMPLNALYSLTKLWRQTSDDLPLVQCPVLVFGSTEDHVVEPTNAMEVVRRVGSPDVNFFALHDSYHVATLDNDAPLIVEQSLKFVERYAATSDVTSVAGNP